MKAENKFLEPSVRRKAAGEAGQCFTLSAAYHTSHTELNCRQTCYETKMCYDIQNNLKKKTKIVDIDGMAINLRSFQISIYEPEQSL